MKSVVVAIWFAVATAHAAPLVFTDGHRTTAHRMETRASGAWNMTWDRERDLAATLYGSHVAVPGSVVSAGVAEQAALAFIAAHRDVIGNGEFVVVANRLDGDIRTIGFEQRWHGLRVVGAQLGIVFSHDRLFALTSQARTITSVVPMSSRARGERVVLEDRVVDHVRDGEWDIYRDDTGEVARQSRRRELTGTLELDAGDRYASGTRSDTLAHTMNLTANTVAVTTNASGVFTFTGANPASIVTSCSGSQVTVIDQTGTNTTTTLDVPANGAAIWNVANSELDDAQVSTYVYGTIATQRALRLDPATSAWLDPFVFYVNEVDPCNAFSDTDGVHLAKSAPGCENTGRVADIVFHEFGHSTHAHEIIVGVGAYDSSLTEGIADFNAANINEDSGIGRGLDYTDAALRDIDPVGYERVYPADISTDPHTTGLIVSGALWDLRKALVAQYGHDPGVAAVEKIFVGVMRRASDIPTSYMAALIADDDNGDLADGTPNFCAIQRAFGVHGLAPDFADTIIGKPAFDNFTISVPITLPVTSTCPARAVVSMHVLWKLGDGVANDLDLAPSTDAWSAAIPPQPDGSTVSYSVDIALDDGTKITYPNNPADPMYQVYIGTPTPIWCDTFDAPPMWTAAGTLPSDWQWARPNSDGPESGDPATVYNNTFIYGTNLMYDGTYPAGLNVTTTTPTITTSDFQFVHVQYWRWLTVEDSSRDQATVAANGSVVWENATDSTTHLDHLDREWRFHDIDLSPQISDTTVNVTWGLASDGLQEYGGWNLDDVCIVGTSKRAVCGDGVVDYREECDDGNARSGDGCSSTCQFEINAGGGCSTTTGTGTNAVLVAAIALLFRRRSKRARARTSLS